MKYSLLIALALMAVAADGSAQTRIWRCGNTYTNNPAEAKAKGCKPLEGGNITVVHEDSPDKFSVAQTVDTAPGARTNALDPDGHRLFLITADVKMENGKRSVAPNSFQVLVAAPKK